MPLEININDEDFHYAEGILLPQGKTFDDERKEFIRNFKTIDLQAVPGSGKTTALLAKLLILEKKMPFQDGSGILVLSHTNAAIDEIKHKIQKYSPRLFSYPNFIGTIQSFVDEFLATPYFALDFNKKPVRIDNEIYEEIMTKRFGALPNSAAKNWLQQKHNPEKFFKDLRFDVNLNLIEGINGGISLRSASNSTTYQMLANIKIDVLKSGFLDYDDAYFLAELYLKNYPKIKNIIQNRFSYVFVDEMQDMDTHQYNLLEKIFYDEGNSISIFQRIGDKNQAIFNFIVKENDIWIDRGEILRLSGSQRLSKPIANVISKFALHTDNNFAVIGLNECGIKPHILIFNNATVNNVIPRFAEIVKSYNENGSLIDFARHPVKVIAWNTEWYNQADKDNVNKFRLVDYYTSFKKDKQKPKQDYSCLKSYLLFYDKDKNTLSPINKNLVSAFLKILRIENVSCEEGTPYTKKKLLNFIKQKDYLEYERFNLNLYNWSINIIRGKIDEVWNEIKVYTSDFFVIFCANPLNRSVTFINENIENLVVEGENANSPKNIYINDGLEIEVTSIHAVKGQTHCASLYLESFFDRGYGNYESERLRNQFLETQTVTQTLETISNSHDKIIQSSKMAYVGFSRPTNLLCVAIHKSRFDSHLTSIDRNKWEIIEI